MTLETDGFSYRDDFDPTLARNFLGLDGKKPFREILKHEKERLASMLYRHKYLTEEEIERLNMKVERKNFLLDPEMRGHVESVCKEIKEWSDKPLRELSEDHNFGKFLSSLKNKYLQIADTYNCIFPSIAVAVLVSDGVLAFDDKDTIYDLMLKESEKLGYKPQSLFDTSPRLRAMSCLDQILGSLET